MRSATLAMLAACLLWSGALPADPPKPAEAAPAIAGPDTRDDAATPASVAQNATTPSAETEAPSKPEMVCRKEAEIGSRVKKTVCRPKSQVDQTGSETRDALQQTHSLGSRTYNNTPGN